MIVLTRVILTLILYDATLYGLTSAAGTGFTGVTAHRSAICGFFVMTCYSGNSSVCAFHECFIRPLLALQ